MSQEAPHILDRESDPRILRDLAKLLDAENKRLRAALEKAQAEQAKEAQAKLNIEESLQILKKKYFGKSSEKSVSARNRDRMNEDAEVLLHSQNLLPPPKDKKIRDLESEEVYHSASDDDLRSMSEALELENPSADQWEEVQGLFDTTTEITVIEREYKKVIHKRKKYKLKKQFAIAEKEVLVSAPGAVKFVPGSSYSIEFATSVVVDKYLNHIPLERQTRMMASLGLKDMHTKVLYNLCRLASVYLEEVVEKIKKEILSSSMIHSDETRWPINNKKDSDGFMWIVANNRGSYYRFEPTRSGKVIKETLEGYVGNVMTDGYSGYYQFKSSSDKKLCMCHAHARRYFWDIKDTNPDCEEIIEMWKVLFSYEHMAKDFDQLKDVREKYSRPLVEKMQVWLQEKYVESREETSFRTAIKYCINHWSELTKFLEDPQIPLTNNEAERTIRQAVMGRKNFYGSRSIDGADVAAVMYTVIESCKKVELDPREYLLATLRAAAGGEPTETPFTMAKCQRH